MHTCVYFRRTPNPNPNLETVFIGQNKTSKNDDQGNTFHSKCVTKCRDTKRHLRYKKHNQKQCARQICMCIYPQHLIIILLPSWVCLRGIKYAGPVIIAKPLTLLKPR